MLITLKFEKADLGYSIGRPFRLRGELTGMEMRRKAETVLGTKFGVRAFHDEVVKDGAMPLQIFEAKMTGWIQKQATGRNVFE